MAAGLNHADPTASARRAPGARPHSPDAELTHWLVECALPLWASTGVDEMAGGFFEKIDMHCRPVEEPRRARVVARQIYVFATAARRGWLRGAEGLVDHGLEFLLGKMRRADGTFASAVRADGMLADGRFDPYEQGFVLFALAAACCCRPLREPALRGEADALLRCLRAHWAHPLCGFQESAPSSVPLRANPHMHLLEAVLAWVELSEGAARREWLALAAELVALCLEKFIVAETGAVHEYFDADWSPMPDARGMLIEPGHQFEWSWRLMRWDELRASEVPPRSRPAAGDGRGKGRGPLARGRDQCARCVVRVHRWRRETLPADRADQGLAGSDGRCDRTRRGGERAARAWIGRGRVHRYLQGVPSGLWHEQMGLDGRFIAQDCRARSPYHIVCAIDTLRDA